MDEAWTVLVSDNQLHEAVIPNPLAFVTSFHNN